MPWLDEKNTLVRIRGDNDRVGLRRKILINRSSQVNSFIKTHKKSANLIRPIYNVFTHLELL